MSLLANRLYVFLPPSVCFQVSSAAFPFPATKKSSCVTPSELPRTSWCWGRTVPLATSSLTASWGRGCCRWAPKLGRPAKEARVTSARGGSCASLTGNRRGSAWPYRVSTNWCTSWRLTVAAGKRCPGKTWRSWMNARIRLTGKQSWK